MKRFLILVLILAVCLAGCKDKRPADVPGGQEAPEGVNWQVWEQYIPATLHMGPESVDVLIALDEIHLAVYYDREEQELLGTITILTPLSDVDYTKERLRVMDVDGDGYDDISIPDMLPNGDRILDCWLWSVDAGAYLYSPEYSTVQLDIGADISWRDGKKLVNGVRDTPDGGEDLLVWIDGQDIYLYADKREEQLIAQLRFPKPLSENASGEVAFRTYWDFRDMNGDGWGDIQIPYRWEETDGGVVAYAYCWFWDPAAGNYQLDAFRSNEPVI